MDGFIIKTTQISRSLSWFRTMKITSRRVIRISLLLMVFHFIAPLSFVNAIPEITNLKETVYQVQLNDLATPVLFKEKDEKKSEANGFENAHITLLDLSIHKLNLKAQHSIRSFYFHTSISFSIHPPVFTLLRTFLI